jgi:hypothetical protein
MRCHRAEDFSKKLKCRSGRRPRARARPFPRRASTPKSVLDGDRTRWRLAVNFGSNSRSGHFCFYFLDLARTCPLEIPFEAEADSDLP